MVNRNLHGLFFFDAELTKCHLVAVGTLARIVVMKLFSAYDRTLRDRMLRDHVFPAEQVFRVLYFRT